jgi:predicted pyridoxine 5'-phosphate oxidase superfamily flavin-nucleotide-binding protein
MAAVLSEAVKAALAGMRIIPVATASAEGVPNVVPLRFVRVIDDRTIVIADNYMSKSATNLAENPQLALTVWDSISKKAFQIKGRARVLTSGPVFDETSAWVLEEKPELRTKAAVLVTVTNVFVCQPGPDLGKDIGTE